MKKKTVFTIIFVIIAAAVIAGGFYALKQKQEREQPQEPESVYTLLDEKYAELAQPMACKLYESDVDGLFYSLNPVCFYYAENGTLSPLKAKGTLHLSPTVGNVQMRFELPFVSVGKEVFGVGLWHSDSGVYNDAFAVLKPMPKALGSTKYLLLIDAHSGDNSATQRAYSEMFAVHKDGSLGARVFDNRNITPEESGKLRTDWNVLTLACLHCGKENPSFTGRKYNRDEKNQLFDLRKGNNAEETVAEKVSDIFLCEENGVLRYLRRDSSAFTLWALQGNKEKKIASWKGNIGADFVLNGAVALNKSEKRAVLLNSAQELSLEKDFKSIYAVAQQGQRLVCIGKEANRDNANYKVQKIVLADPSFENRQTLYFNNIMDENSTLLLCSEGILTLQNGKSVFISYKAVETLLENVVQ